MEDVLKPHGSLLATDRSKAVIGVILTNCFVVGVSCRNLCSLSLHSDETKIIYHLNSLFGKTRYKTSKNPSRQGVRKPVLVYSAFSIRYMYNISMCHSTCYTLQHAI